MSKLGQSQTPPIAPPVRVTGVRGRPLIPTGMGESDMLRILDIVAREVLKQMRAEMQRMAFSPRARKTLAASLKVELKPKSVLVVSTHPGFKPLVMGQKTGQMKWLVKARKPIPIITDDGETIFRTATPKSMADGKWIHPGRATTGLVEKAKRAARKKIRERLAKEFARALVRGVR